MVLMHNITDSHTDKQQKQPSKPMINVATNFRENISSNYLAFIGCKESLKGVQSKSFKKFTRADNQTALWGDRRQITDKLNIYLHCAVISIRQLCVCVSVYSGLFNLWGPKSGSHIMGTCLPFWDQCKVPIM